MILKDLNKSLLINISLVFLIFLLDRVSKIYVINLDKKLIGSEIFLSKYLNITPIWNRGISFGLLPFEDIVFYNFLSLFIGIIILILIILSMKSEGIKKFLLLIIIGGALGNLYDRIKFNAVFYFIDLHIENFHWFIFNVSDIFITLGVVGMIITELIQKKEKNSD